MALIYSDSMSWFVGASGLMGKNVQFMVTDAPQHFYLFLGAALSPSSQLSEMAVFLQALMLALS